MQNRIHFIFIQVVFSLVVVLASACSAFPPRFKSEAVKPLAQAPEIIATDQEGNNFQLSRLQGQVVLVFFGFTNCVDECPATLAHIKLALGQLGTDLNQPQVVLITTDPIRDGQHALHDFLMKFDPAYLGITGQLEDMQMIWQSYDVVVLDGGETHSSYIYVVDQQGDLRLRIPADTTPEDMAADLQILLAEKPE